MLNERQRERIATALYNSSVAYWSQQKKNKRKQPSFDELSEDERKDYLNTVDVAAKEILSITSLIQLEPRTHAILMDIVQYRGYENIDHLIFQLLINTLELESMEQFAADMTASLEEANEKLDSLLKG